MPKLIIKLGENVLREVQIEKPAITIGRKPGHDIHLDNLAVSSSHARIVRDGNDHIVEDSGSLNGTFVNGARVERQKLAHHDEISIGKHTVLFLGEEDGGQHEHEDTVIEGTMVLDTRKHREMSGKVPSPGPRPGEAVGVLSVLGGSAERNEYLLAGEFAAIGKSKEAEMRIRGFFAPGIAALLQRVDDGRFFLSPPERGVKPRINGVKIGERTELQNGDTIRAGGVTMLFSVRQYRIED
jgi:pSer/pThr/pTyr-binding forkhead associated (FHA) protein